MTMYPDPTADFANLFSTNDDIANKALGAKLAALRRDQSMNSLGMMTGDSALASEGKVMSDLTGNMQKIVAGTPQHRLTLALERQKNADTARHQVATEKTAQDTLGLHRQQLTALERHQQAMEKKAQDQLDMENWVHVAQTATQPGYLYNKKTAEVKPMQGLPGIAFDPAAPGKALTEGQMKNYEAADRIINNLAVVETGGPTGVSGRKDLAAHGGGNFMRHLVPQEAASEGGRLYFDAAKNVIAGLLRKESGAAISDSEWNELGPNYVPMPWDNEETRKAKVQRLRAELQALIAQSGGGAGHLTTRAKSLYGGGVLAEPGIVPVGSAAQFAGAPSPGAAPAAPAAQNPRASGGLNYSRFGYRP